MDHGRRAQRTTLTRADWVAVAALVAVATCFVRWRGDFSLSPWEDAAMLLRYSENLATGHGIVWNVGERPEDGATDFVFMLVVALVRSLGAGIVPACRIVGFAFHLATIPIVYWAMRGVAGAPRWMAFLGGGYIALGPGMRYIEGGFGTTVFAFFGLSRRFDGSADGGPRARRGLIAEGSCA